MWFKKTTTSVESDEIHIPNLELFKTHVFMELSPKNILWLSKVIGEYIVLMWINEMNERINNWICDNLFETKMIWLKSFSDDLNKLLKKTWQ